MTLWIPDAPRVQIRVPCTCSQFAPGYCEEPPPWDVLTEYAREDCPFCEGKGWYESTDSTAPSFNLSNASMRDMLEALGLPPDDSGHIDVGDLPAVLRRAIKVMNVGREAEAATRETEVFEGGRFISFGLTESDVRYAMGRILEVLKYGNDHKQTVVWA